MDSEFLFYPLAFSAFYDDSEGLSDFFYALPEARQQEILNQSTSRDDWEQLVREAKEKI